MAPVDVEIEVLGQTPFLKIFTQLSFVFHVESGCSDSAIVGILTRGLERLTEAFPWVAGQVVCDDNGVFRIREYKTVPPMVVRDLREELPSLSEMERAQFPMSMLDENKIAYCKTIPGDVVRNFPVLALQVTFIEGGIILTVNGEHNAMDMTGQEELIRLFSKACHGELFTDEEVRRGNVPREQLIPLLSATNEELRPFLEYQVLPPPPSQPPSPANACWTYFNCSKDSLSKLKKEATGSLPQGTTYISTDDALSALIWKSVSKVRLPRLENSNTNTQLSRAIDVRKYLNISPSYPGLCQNMTYQESEIHILANQPIGEVAALLRSKIDPEQLVHNTQALATYVHNKGEPGTSATATVDTSTGLMLSSWAKMDGYSFDFNLGLGDPVVVKRPQFDPVESLLYFMPKNPNGDIAIGICLRDVDMDALRADETFTSYCDYVG